MQDLINILNKTCFYLDEGMYFDAKFFLEEAEYIDSFEIKKIKNIDDQKFKIKIKLKEYSYHAVVNEYFMDFLKFMQYSVLNLYFFNENSNSLNIIYYTVFKSINEYKGAKFEIEYF